MPKPDAARPQARSGAVAVAGTVLALALAGTALLGSGWWGPGPATGAASPAPGGGAAGPTPDRSAPSPSGSLATGSPAGPTHGPGASPAIVAPSPQPSPVPSGGPAAAPVPAVGPPPVTVPAWLDARLDAALARAVSALDLPGASVAVSWANGAAWSGAWGAADLERGIPLTTATALPWASVSKSMTAAAVLALVDEGRLRLDEPVRPLLPRFDVDRRITVRMLLEHTSGLPDYFRARGIDAALRAEPDAPWSAARVWTFFGGRPVTTPGAAFAYANSNFLLLGELVATIRGTTLAAELRARFVDPLHLAATWFQDAEAPRAPGVLGYRRTVVRGRVRHVAVAPPGPVMPFRSVVTAAGGAGSLAGTAADAARWMRAYAGGELLGPATRREILLGAPSTVERGAPVPYGFGVLDLEIDGRRALGHGGRFLGFRHLVVWVPELRASIAVLTNQSAWDAARLTTAVLRVLLPREGAAPRVPPPGRTIHVGLADRAR